MKTIRTLDALREETRRWRQSGESVGLVPTMGALHDGHMSLVRNAHAQNDRVITSIFVNPRQFNQASDLEAYPRDEEADAAKLREAGVDVLWAPDVDQIYPEGFATTVEVTGITDCLCGATRPGHFSGVALVVTKLLLQSLPDRAYFGRKDFQQLQVVRRLARDLDIPVEIRGIDTVRERDGLAMSSRNWYLTAEERSVAPLVFRLLTNIAEAAGSGDDPSRVIERGRKQLADKGFGEIDYLEIRDSETFELVRRPTRPARAFAAVFLGKARLIDNVPVDPAA